VHVFSEYVTNYFANSSCNVLFDLTQRRDHNVFPNFLNTSQLLGNQKECYIYL